MKRSACSLRQRGRYQLSQLREGASGAPVVYSARARPRFTLDQVRELLGLADDRQQSCAAVDAIATTHLTQIDRKIADLQALRGELSRLIGDRRQGTVADCLIIDSLAPAGLAQ